MAADLVEESVVEEKAETGRRLKREINVEPRIVYEQAATAGPGTGYLDNCRLGDFSSCSDIGT